MSSVLPEPEPESTTTPEPEPKAEFSTPEPEISTIFTQWILNTTAEPEPGRPEPEIVKKSGFEVSPEPQPEFDIAREIWGGAWPAHIYIFAILFTLLMLYNLNSIVGLIQSKRGAIRRKKIFLLTNIQLFFFNFITAFHLFFNPYESNELIEIKLPGLLFIFFGLRLPCLTGAFSLILITLIETTKVKLYSRKLQNIWYLLGVISIHYIVVITIHFYLVFHQDEYQLLAICQVFYIAFGLVVSATVLYSYMKVRQQLLQEEEALTKIIYRSFRFGKGKRKRKNENEEKKEELELTDEKSKVNEENVQLIKTRSPFVDRSLRRLFTVATVISLSGILYCIAVFYSVVSMLIESATTLKPWPWLIYQTLSRLAEIGMVIGMSYLVRRSILPCCVVMKGEETVKNTTAVSLSAASTTTA